MPLGDDARTVSDEEMQSFYKAGVFGKVSFVRGQKRTVSQTILGLCEEIYRRKSILRLGRESKVLRYNSVQTLSQNGSTAYVNLSDMKLVPVYDSDDGKLILSAVDKPDIRFSDVIGAQDAKDELAYFVRYLKDPRGICAAASRRPRACCCTALRERAKRCSPRRWRGNRTSPFCRRKATSF